MTRGSVLLVGDDEVEARRLAEELRRIGWRMSVLPAGLSVGPAGMQAVSSPHPPDVLLIDVGPGRFEEVAPLRARHAGATVLLTAPEDGAVPEDARALRPDGWVVKPVDLASLDAALHVAFRRADGLRRAAERAHEQAVQACVDPVTGLPNRAGLEQRFAVATERAGRTDGGLLVCVIELLGLAGIDRRLGPDAGEAVRIAVARRLSDAIRRSDTVARLPDDRFVVLAEEIDPPGGPLVASRLLRAFETPIEWMQVPVELVPVIGRATWRDDGASLDDLLAAAAPDAG